MSLFLDQKYLSLISNRLPLFKKKGDRLYNCRCVLCGDSVKNRNKARGYFFEYKADLRYKCHNCDASMTFHSFLKQLDTNLYSQYALEKYSEGGVNKFNNTLPIIKFEEPIFTKKEKKLIDQLMIRLDTLEDSHEAVQFCENRKIPRKKFSLIYFIDNIKSIVQLNDKYKELIKGEEPRIVFPFYDETGQLTGVTCRALRGEALRYITVKIKDDVPLIYGIEELNKNTPVKVVEGPIDSLFLDNCIAVTGTSFNKIDNLSLNNPVLIFDNQPRNKELCKIIERNIDQGKQVVIWPQNISEKDINEMVLAGRNVNKIIEQNIYSGLSAKVKFTAWKRV